MRIRSPTKTTSSMRASSTIAKDFLRVQAVADVMRFFAYDQYLFIPRPVPAIASAVYSLHGQPRVRVIQQDPALQHRELHAPFDALKALERILDLVGRRADRQGCCRSAQRRAHVGDPVEPSGKGRLQPSDRLTVVYGDLIIDAAVRHIKNIPAVAEGDSFMK